MQLQLPSHPLGSTLGATCTVAGVIVATIVISRLSEYRKLSAIPAVGPSGWLASWWIGQQSAHELLLEGYRKYKPLPFRMINSGHWLVLVTSRQHLEELRKAPDDALSVFHERNKSMKFQHTIGYEIVRVPYHADVVRAQLTRNLANVYPDMRDEIAVAFDDVLDLQGNEWKGVPALITILQVVCRASNRVFVGLPLCRDPDWMDLNLRFTMNVVYAGQYLKHLPDFLAPLIVRFMTDIPASKKRAAKHLAPILEARLKLYEQHGNDWAGKPNDCISWLLDAPEDIERTVDRLAGRVLALSFASIHTSSVSFVYALFYLAGNPEYIEPLRKEVETIVETDGWSKASIAKMHKVDSFIKESQRMVGLGSLGLQRLAMKDFRFSDGTLIPKGITVGAPVEPLHLDGEHYEDAHVFKPFRFADMRDADGSDSKYDFASTSPEYLPFGHGRHACPGRFFASNELKTLLAYIVATYDVKLEGGMPKVTRMGLGVFPDLAAKVQFRRRVH